MPDLRLPRGSRRPVRQLRQPTRPDRPDRSALADRRLDARVPGDEASLPRPAAVRRCPAHLDRRAGGVALERQELLAPPARRDPSAPDHTRSRLGGEDPDPRLRGGREQADLRVVRRRHRLPVGQHRVGVAHRRPRGVAGLVAEPRRVPRVLPGEGQHRLPLGDLAGDAPRLRHGRRVRGGPRTRSSCPTTSSPRST